ncbi:MAG: hypothetical protein EA409_08600 [Saprospirales bacterium]|nr:MAG: hypothetical protein EA409_08600 [Saprospirales bacterium]
MDLLKVPFTSHFENYGSRFYKVSPAVSTFLNREEKDLLNDLGLPDSAVPFFYFDLNLAELRDVTINDSILILGTALEMAGFDYLYINDGHKVVVKLSEGPVVFVNSSLKHLMGCIYEYSLWLEEMEDKACLEGCLNIEKEDIFDLFYILRSIDPQAVREDSFWSYIVHTEMNVDSILVD